jgi:hypothetical protein
MTPNEIMSCASEAYSFMKAQTNKPSEFADILCAVHVMLWLNCSDGTTPPEDMLELYKKVFMDNYRRNLDA